MNVTGIIRNARFSPNRSEADAAIFEAVATRLEANGHRVARLTEAQFLNAFPDDNPTYEPAIDKLLSQTTCIFTMGRENATTCMLDVVERFQHIRCVNTARGIAICNNRALLYEQMRRAGIPQPQTWFGSLYQERWDNDPEDAYSLAQALPYPLWMKRADGPSLVQEDIVFAAHAAQAQTALKAFAERGIEEVAFCQHIDGDLIKFYGVAGTAFFDWDYADLTQSKFGQEHVNGTPHRYAFHAAQLQAQCNALAERIGVPVYGGDAIVQQDGTYVIIDFNDWPSYSRCKEQAADAIVQLLLK